MALDAGVDLGSATDGVASGGEMILQLGMPKLMSRTSDTKQPKPVGVVEEPQRWASRSPDRPEALRLSLFMQVRDLALFRCTTDRQGARTLSHRVAYELTGSPKD